MQLARVGTTSWSPRYICFLGTRLRGVSNILVIFSKLLGTAVSVTYWSDLNYRAFGNILAIRRNTQSQFYVAAGSGLEPSPQHIGGLVTY